jgi:hypothetical protein
MYGAETRQNKKEVEASERNLLGSALRSSKFKMKMKNEK